MGGVYDLLLYNSSDDTGRQAQVAADKAGWIEVTGLFKTEPVCDGNVSVQKCLLHHAVVEYDVAWSNGALSLRKKHWQDDNVLFHTYVPAESRSPQNSPLTTFYTKTIVESTHSVLP